MTQLTMQVFPGVLGQRIFNEISAERWRFESTSERIIDSPLFLISCICEANAPIKYSSQTVKSILFSRTL